MVMYSKEDILKFNEQMIGRGVPSQDDGVGYNRADYSICVNCSYGSSDAQVAELAKRLVKYCATQLGAEKEKMQLSHLYFSEKASKKGFVASDGISLGIEERETRLYFRYNPSFVKVISEIIGRKWDKEQKTWIIPNHKLIDCLEKLKEIGADVENAIEESNANVFVKDAGDDKVEILVREDLKNNVVFLKIPYDSRLISEIQNIKKEFRAWNNKHKFWTINKDSFEMLKDKISVYAIFKEVS